MPLLAAEVIVGPNRATKALGALTALGVEWESMFNIKYLKAQFFFSDYNFYFTNKQKSSKLAGISISS